MAFAHPPRPLPMLAPLVTRLALAGLCSAYIQGPLVKILDFGGAIGEMVHFGLEPAPLFAAGVIIFELVPSAMVITGIYRSAAAFALAAFTLAATFVALRFWDIPPGPGRTMAMNGFFEHLGLVAAFILVAMHDAWGAAAFRSSSCTA